MAAAGWKFLVVHLAHTHTRRIKVSYLDTTEAFFVASSEKKKWAQHVWRGYTLLEDISRSSSHRFGSVWGLFFKFIVSFISIYCQGSCGYWNIFMKQSQKMSADIAMWGVWRHFHRVFNLAGLWEIKGPSDVLPVPLKMRRAPLLICLLLPFSLCAHWSLWSGESVVPIA